MSNPPHRHLALSALATCLQWACVVGEPAELPLAREAPTIQADVRRVAAPGVDGLLGRPLVEPPVPAVLLLVESLDEASQGEVLRRTETGQGVLAILPEQDIGAAWAYLDGMPWTGTLTRVCLREASHCPEAEEKSPP